MTVSTEHLLGLVLLLTVIAAAMAQRFAQEHLDNNRLEKWTGLDRHIRAYWVTRSVLKPSGHIYIRIRSVAVCIAVIVFMILFLFGRSGIFPLLQG